MIRARSPEAKAKRRAQILRATADVLAADGLEGCSLNAIASRAGIVKSNIYRYFESREEILLRLLLDDLTGTCDGLSMIVSGPMSVKETAQLLANGFVASPRLCLLISQLAPTLEHNIRTDTLREIKRALLVQSNRASAALTTALPALPHATAQQAIHLLFSLVAGLWPMSNPGPELANLLAEPEFAPLGQSFADRIHDAILILLSGLTTVAKQDPHNRALPHSGH